MVTRLPDERLQRPGPIEHWEATGSALELHHRQGLTRLEAIAPEILRNRVPGDTY